MKLKQISSDFIVEEITSIDIFKEKKEHSIYILEKKEIDTFDAIRLISNHINIPFKEIGFAGLKDKHAITKQYISIPSKFKIDFLIIKNISLRFLGYFTKKIKTGDLKGNKFTITVRNIKQRKLNSVYEKAKNIRIFGVPNYFDSQRFGSVFNDEFIAKYIIKKDYEKAVKIFLTRYHKSENKYIKNEKRLICTNWTNLEKISLDNNIFQKIINAFLKNKNWLDGYKKIPQSLREMFINSYQSYLWNECIKELFKICINGRKLYSVEYALGSLYFFKDLDEEEVKNLPVFFPTLSEKVILSNFEEKIVKKILNVEGLKLNDFTIESDTGNFFKTRKRDVRIIPETFSISKPFKDELNSINTKPQNKIILSFCLPKGCYATMITKKLFGH